MTRRVFGMGLAALGLFAALLGTGGSRADHASIPIEPLQAYHKLDPSSVTVSGLSSGAFFAHQFHVAYSSLVKGAGMVDGGLYRCAEQIDQISPPFGNPLFLFGVSRSVVAALAVCTTLGRNDFKQFGWQFPDKPDAKESQKLAQQAYADVMIDDPANLASSKVWLFHGTEDGLVPRATMDQLKTFYQLMGVPAANITARPGPDARHGMPIKTLPAGGGGQHCKLPDPSYLIQCDYGAAELLLSNLYPTPAPAPAGDSPKGQIVGFDQTEFFDTKEPSVSLNRAGYIYVPEACKNESAAAVTCRLHVAFHGCEQYVDKIHDLFFRDAGYNAWADANNVIVLYPQAAPWLRVSDFSQLSANPQGCWDWWGYSGDDYFSREGKQMRAVKAMVDRMLP
jgi:poly(3-hydroxybutyrate) depolymerase